MERYDLVIPRAHYESDLLRPLLDMISGPKLRQVVAGLPGYDTTHMGEVVIEL
jgi:putative molybdopterin biosynthesis protein